MIGQPSHRSAGFTLVELMVGLTVMSLILAGVSSAILIATKAVPSPASAVQCVQQAASQAEWLASDLQYADSVSIKTDRCIQFTLADRNGDSLPEVVRYEWAGATGDPLVRTFNGISQVVLANVHQFKMDYSLRSPPGTPAEDSESGEILLAGNVQSSNLNDFPIRGDRYAGQYVHPVLPADAVSWKVSRVKFLAKNSGWIGGRAKVRLCSASSGGLPISVIEEQVLMEESLGETYSWQEFTFSTASGLEPGEGVCLVLGYVVGGEVCRVQYQDRSSSAPDSAFIRSTDGIAWSAPAGQMLIFEMYGTVTTAGKVSSATTGRLERITLDLQQGSSASAAQRTSVRLLNRPEVQE